jgi:hypothetical protein
MDFSRIFQRAFDLTRSYRALWLFGILFAATSLHGGGGNGGGGGGNGGGSSSLGFPEGLASKMVLAVSDPTPQGIALVVIVLGGLALLVAVVFTAVHVVSDTALIRMVDGAEETGERAGVSRGFRLGWSRAAWRIFLIDLLTGAAAVVVSLLLLGIALAPLLAWLTQSDALRAIGTVFAVVLVLPVIMIIILGAIALVVLKEYFHRASAIEGHGVFAALRRGWQMARGHIGDTLLMAVALFCLGLAAALVMLPVVALLVGVGLVAGGIPGAIAALVSTLFAGGAVPWMVGAVIGLPIFVLVLGIPIVFASGLVQVFSSSAWTLAYRGLIQ